ncbi:MAG TPA: NTP transferase domain-containing protein [Chloroflexota bacterium]|jgi:bifunctional UDP-N-acetylglucosamine pyrophosphorylase/glucosamine-1-phosphate N-acetyltransferase|nr:NTP transferase domain-containing protein [Chloroflexota bacterium]
MTTPVAVLLAGGANRRFWPLTQKSLLPFGGRALLERRIDELVRAGVAEVVIVANSDNEARMRAIAGSAATARVHVVVQTTPGGMGDALLRCAPLLEGELAGRPLLVNQVHDLVESELFGSLLAALEKGDADAFVVGVKLTSYFPGGYLSVEGDRAVSVVEKPPPGSEPSDLMKIVADLIRRPSDLLAALRSVEPNPDDQYERAWAKLMAARTVRVFGYSGPWVPIKYPWDVLRATELMLVQLTKAGTPPPGAGTVVHPTATVSGPVLLGERVRVWAGAAIVGPAIVGDDTIVGNGALVRGSIVGRGCTVGFATEVARSYLGDGCELHTNYVGDSVLGDDVSFGSGTVTANLRLPEDNVRITVEGQRLDTGRQKVGALVGSHVRVGINASLMPGVRIGSKAAVGPGVLLKRDLPDGQMVTVRQELDVQPNPFDIDGTSRDTFRAALRKRA